MSEYNPPNNVEELSVFNTANFIIDTAVLTTGQLDGLYLKYPTAQGTENLLDVFVDGDAVFNSSATFNGGLTINSALQANAFYVVSSALAIEPVGNYLRFINNNATNTGFNFYIPNAVGVNPNIMTMTNGGVQINNNVQLNGFGLSLDSNDNVGLKMSNSFQTFNIVNPFGLFNISSAVGGTNYITITPSLTTVNTPTQINTLTSTTQANNDNSTKVATTQYVANMIATIPSSATIIPYLYGFSPNQIMGASNFISINFTNGATLNINTYFTLRCQIQYTWNTTGGISALNPYFLNYEFLIDVYPNRVPTINAGNNNSLPNGSINGNANYVITPNDPIYSPNGRWYWIRNYSSSSASPTSPSAITNPFYFLTLSQSRISFILNPPDFSNTGYYNIEASVEIINRSSGTTFTSGGINGFTSFYNSF
jgi:hypothetical protein